MASAGRVLTGIRSRANARRARVSRDSRVVDGRLWPGIFVVALLLLTAACTTDQFRGMHRQEDPDLYKSDGLDAAKASAMERRSKDDARAAAAADLGDDTLVQEREQEQTQFEPGAKLPPMKTVAVTVDQDYVPTLDGGDIEASYNNIPVPAFIDTVFGEQLGLPYSLDTSVQSLEDLVTLRLTSAIEPEQLFRVARRTLVDYGVRTRFEQGVFVFNVDKNIGASDVPILVTGLALPEVPESHRPVFVFVPLKAVTPPKVNNWLRTGLSGQELRIQMDLDRNAMVLTGKTSVVEQALAMIEVLDQPHMRGKFSINIEPAHAQAADLAADLVAVLQSEGYEVSTRPPNGAIMIIPLKSTNQLVAFAASQQTLDHVANWARIIDRRQQLAVEDGIFSYEVNNTQADYIVDMLNQLADPEAEVLDVQSSAVADAGQAVSRRGTISQNRGRSQFVVDTNRNAIIYRGSGKQWSQLLPVIQQMDKVAPSVLVEVLLAEISLTDTDSSSFQFLTRSSLNNSYDLTTQTLDFLDSGRSAFSATLDKAGDVRAVLRVLYENRRAEIRSRPRLMVKSGQTASIDVGDEIPVLTTASQSTNNPDAPIVTEVVYRSTGVKLQIRPVVHNSGFVDIEVTQELSEAEVNETSGIDSPTIRNRTLTTMVTLRDGGSILLGGLISSVTSDNESGVPFLGNLPGLGALFRSDGETEDRRELLVMIIPYIMETPLDSEELTEQLTDAFQVNASAGFAEP